MNKDLIEAHQRSVLLLIKHLYEDLHQGITDPLLADLPGRIFALRSAHSQIERLQRCLPCLYDLCYHDVAECDPNFVARCPVTPFGTTHGQEICCILQQIREESHP